MGITILLIVCATQALALMTLMASKHSTPLPEIQPAKPAVYDTAIPKTTKPAFEVILRSRYQNVWNDEEFGLMASLGSMTYILGAHGNNITSGYHYFIRKDKDIYGKTANATTHVVLRGNMNWSSKIIGESDTIRDGRQWTPSRHLEYID